MELQQLRYVLAVAEHKNFTRAAQSCHVVQSALSHQIKVLEHEIGTQLFARTSRKVELTEAGVAFLPSARASLEAAERAVSEALATTGEIRGKLSVGIIPTVTGIDLAAALGEFHRDNPVVHVSLSTGDSNAFIESIRAGSMDVAVLGLPGSTAPKQVASRILARERLVAVLDAGHRLAEHQRLGLVDLSDELFVDFPADSPGRAQSDIAFDSVGVSRHVAFEATNVDLMLDLTAQGLAIALMSEALVPANRGLVAVPLSDGPSRTEYLAWSEFNPSPAALAFIAILEKNFKVR
ncbi:LysR substrate-binding domain-containing protein [Glutamicibacter sp. NPDC127525]|uniref:LysR substrate-binding domain-containing protein n=1 Tax=unclassified Glutamicibacter TaxID=2627139 RepID=UPI0036343D06